MLIVISITCQEEIGKQVIFKIISKKFIMLISVPWIWAAVTAAHIRNALEWGVAPAEATASPSPSPTARKFLVIVSKPSYDYGYGEMASNLSVYLNDLTAEGWSPRLITVDNTESTNSEYTCPNADALKAKIEEFYNDYGLDLVLI